MIAWLIRIGKHDAIPSRLTLSVTNFYCVCCAEEIEARLCAEPHITRARVGFYLQTVSKGPRV